MKDIEYFCSCCKMNIKLHKCPSLDDICVHGYLIKDCPIFEDCIPMSEDQGQTSEGASK